MTRYTVLPKNPACQSPIIEADGYTWSGGWVTFWRSEARVVSRDCPEPQEVMVTIGKPEEIYRLAAGQTIVPMHQTVAEFAVDWVAGVVLEVPETAKAD